MKMVLVVSLFVCGLAVCKATNGERSTWFRQKVQGVTAFHSMTSASSEVMCVRQCMSEAQGKHCVYDSRSGICYLQTSAAAAATDASEHHLTQFTEILCETLEDPFDYATIAITLQEAENWTGVSVRCKDEDMMFFKAISLHPCSMKGQCRLNVWRNQLSPGATIYYLPATPEPGWAVCLHGPVSMTASDPRRMDVNLYDRSGHHAFHMEYMENGGSAMLVCSTKENDTWHVDHISTLNELAVDSMSTSTMTLVAADLRTIEVNLNETPQMACPSTVPLNQVTTVEIVSIAVAKLDLWCLK